MSLAVLLAGGTIVGCFLLLTAKSGRAMGDDEEVLVYKPYWVHLNQIGAPVRLTDADGAVVWAAEYEPFGKTMSLENEIIHEQNSGSKEMGSCLALFFRLFRFRNRQRGGGNAHEFA